MHFPISAFPEQSTPIFFKAVSLIQALSLQIFSSKRSRPTIGPILGQQRIFLAKEILFRVEDVEHYVSNNLLDHSTHCG